MKKIIIICIFVMSLIFTTSMANAGKYKKNGYTIEIYYKEKGKKLKTWGKVSGGKKCKQLNIDIYLKNSVTHDFEHLDTKIKKYNPKRSNNYSAKIFYERYKRRSGGTIIRKKSKYKWYVDNFYLHCYE